MFHSLTPGPRSSLTAGLIRARVQHHAPPALILRAPPPPDFQETESGSEEEEEEQLCIFLTLFSFNTTWPKHVNNHHNKCLFVVLTCKDEEQVNKPNRRKTSGKNWVLMKTTNKQLHLCLLLLWKHQVSQQVENQTWNCFIEQRGDPSWHVTMGTAGGEACVSRRAAVFVLSPQRHCRPSLRLRTDLDFKLRTDLDFKHNGAESEK